MAQDSKIPNEDQEKSSFWEKLSAQNDAAKHKSNLVKNSLVDAIVSQAERESSQPKIEQRDTEKATQTYKSTKNKIQGFYGFSKTVLTLTIILSLGIWAYFYAVLSESNYFHQKIDQQNLTTLVNQKTQYLAQLEIDNTDTQKFSKLLRIEDLANQIVDLDLENPVLNYKRPQGEKVISREDNGEPLYRTVDTNGQIIYLAEADVLALENARDVRIEFTKNALDQILADAEELKALPDSNAAIETEFKQLTGILVEINPKEVSFPSAITKENYQAAQMVAQSILTKVKNLNLENLVADIKKQAAAIDVTSADMATQAVVGKLKNIVTQISDKRLSSFETALGEAAALNVDQITDNDVYQKTIRITGTPGKKANDGDLAAATVIAHNLGKVNIINQFKAGRVPWSNVIDRVEKIARLGSDLERDPANTTYADPRADIDPEGKYVTFTGYAGKLNKSEIELRGNALGDAIYRDRNFTLLADLIDAFEGSKYFKEVDGFSFTKNKNRQDEYFAPLNFTLKIQNPSVADPLDVKVVTPIVKKTNSENINLNSLNDLNFATPKTEEVAAPSAEEKTEAKVETPTTTSETMVEEKTAETTPEAETRTTEATTISEDKTTDVDVFGYLTLILNPSN